MEHNRTEQKRMKKTESNGNEWKGTEGKGKEHN